MNPHKDWAQVQIQEARLPTKNKIIKIFICFKRCVFVGGLEASPGAWKSFAFGDLPRRYFSFF